MKFSERTQEILAPYFWSIIISIPFWLLPTPTRLKMEKDLGNGVLTMISIMAAITLSSLTIVLSQPLGIKALRAEHPSQFQKFIDFHFDAIWVAVSSCILSLFVLFLCPPTFEFQKRTGYIHFTVFVIWIISFWASLFTFMRIANLMRRILMKYS
jgi:hypothetical protein